MFFQNDDIAICRTKYYNFNFDKKTGYFERYGRTKKTEDDPAYSPIGPEIADIEVTTICHGINNKPCAFCYKSNTSNGKNMSYDTFVKLFHKLPRTVTQIAFGVDSRAESNPDLFKIMDYCRNNNYNKVVPNITVAEISDEIADKLASVCGAVAVSRSSDKNICYNSVKKLIDRGLKQVNIHVMISEETYNNALETLKDKITDKRLADLNAIVFLSLKKKGRGIGFTPLSTEKFRKLVNFAFKHDIGIGFDSCSSGFFLETIKDLPNKEKLTESVESCESFGLFSSYFNVDGEYFPCSFVEGECEWENGLNVLNCNDFLKDIWYHPLVNEGRKRSIESAKECPLDFVKDCRQCLYFEELNPWSKK